MRRLSPIVAVVAGLGVPAASAEDAIPPIPAKGGTATAGAPTDEERVKNDADLARFLDGLMIAESGGRDDARNPRSTAVGPFQFIESTFLDVTQRHFQAETAALTPAAILQLRTNRAFARKAAEAFTRDNAAAFAAEGLSPTFANLRLAFLVGPGGAIRLLKAEPRTLAINILGAQVVQANPFMAGMTASDLARWSGRNLAVGDLDKVALAVDPARIGARGRAKAAKAAKPAITVRCNQALTSCKRWIALATQRLEHRQVASRTRTPRR